MHLKFSNNLKDAFFVDRGKMKVLEDIKRKKFTVLVLLILSGLLYSIFLSGYFSRDTYNMIIGLGYKGYAINYSFYDGRVIMGLICMLADILNINIRAFYISLLVMSIIVSTITIIKILNIIEDKKKPKGKLQYVLLVIITYLYIFNFMTIDNMGFAENFVMSLSVWFYVLSIENMIIKHNWKKALLYCIIGIFSYQGTINMLFITSILILLIEKNKFDKKVLKELALFLGIISISSLFNFIFVKIITNCINSIQSSRVSLEILSNIVSNLKNITYLLYNTIELFPSGVYAGFIIITLIITYIYSIKEQQMKPFIIAIILFIMSIVSSLILLFIYENGICCENGRIFGSIGANFSVIWLYLYANTDILDKKHKLKLIATILIIIYFILNGINILYITHLYKKGNEIDEQLAKQIEQKIEDYEKSGENKIEYIAVKYINGTELKDIQQYNGKTLKKSMKDMGLFNKNTLKAYTKVNPNIETVYFEDKIIEKYFGSEKENIQCIGNTVYVAI
jgi:hypothetical protein